MATAKRQPWRTYLEQPSALSLLGDLSSLSVLDLGCGEGHYTRLLRQLSADQVPGVDLSSDLIELARAQELSHPLGVDHRVCDAAELKLQTTFDLVFAGHLFNHARDREELPAQFSSVSSLLRPGGRLVALNNTPPTTHLQTSRRVAPTATARASMALWWRELRSITASNSKTAARSSSPTTTSASR